MQDKIGPVIIIWVWANTSNGAVHETWDVEYPLLGSRYQYPDNGIG